MLLSSKIYNIYHNHINFILSHIEIDVVLPKKRSASHFRRNAKPLSFLPPL